MATSRDILLAEIEAYLKRTGMGRTYFGHVVGAGGELVDRLRDGRDVTTRTMDAIYRFIRAHPDGAPQKERRAPRRGDAQQAAP